MFAFAFGGLPVRSEGVAIHNLLQERGGQSECSQAEVPSCSVEGICNNNDQANKHWL